MVTGNIARATQTTPPPSQIKISFSRTKDTKSWRVGTVVSARGNGTFGVEYDEPGAPKEDRVAENRLRRRHVADYPADSSTRSRSETGQEMFEEGDTVLAEVDGRGGREPAEAKVEAYLGDGLYRVSSVHGSGTTELQSHRLRYVHRFRPSSVHSLSRPPPPHPCLHSPPCRPIFPQPL